VRERVIGILGGMGPEATVDLYRRILLHTGARTDQEHFRVIIDSNPKIPDRTAALLGRGEDPVPLLCETAQNLERAGADFVVMPCNTAHAFLAQTRGSVGIPVLSIVDETIRALRERLPEAKRVGLMATPGVVKTRLYEDPLRKRGIATLAPTRQKQQLLVEVISSVKAGDKGPRVRAQAKAIARALIGAGAQALLLACTEIPLVLGPEDLEVPVLDTLEVLALAAVREARATTG